LLGCVALRVGKKLEWDGPKMHAKNAPEAAHFIKREYRKGWSLNLAAPGVSPPLFSSLCWRKK